MSSDSNHIFILDTTLRDGMLMPRVAINIDNKIQLAQLLDEAGVDIIEISYPGQSAQDFEEMSLIVPHIKRATICALAGSRADDIQKAAAGLQKAAKGRIHIYTNVGKGVTSNRQSQTLEAIASSVVLARNYCDDVQWSAFDATRSEPDFLYRAVELAIAKGATTINIPDSLGRTTSTEFSLIIKSLFCQVPNIDRAVISVHCHNDLGIAVPNSLAASEVGARQIECTLKGLGARKGNAALETIVAELNRTEKYQHNLELSLLDRALEILA
jgi:2-isopropylmalate synthase